MNDLKKAVLNLAGKRFSSRQELMETLGKIVTEQLSMEIIKVHGENFIGNGWYEMQPTILADKLDARDMKAAQGSWVPANGGTEQPFTTRNNRKLLYCYQPSTGRHAYCDLAKDIMLSDEEAAEALGLL